MSVTRSTSNSTQSIKAGVPNFDREMSTGGGGIDATDKSPKTSVTDPATTRSDGGLPREAGDTSTILAASAVISTTTVASSGAGGVGRFNVKRVVADQDQHSPRELSTPTPSQVNSPTPPPAPSNTPASSNSGSSNSKTNDMPLPSSEEGQHQEKLERTKSPLGRFSVKPVVAASVSSTSSTVDATSSSSATKNISSSSLKQVTSTSTSASTQQNAITPQSSFETIDSAGSSAAQRAPERGTSSPRMTRWTSQDASTDTELDAKEDASSRSSSRLSRSKPTLDNNNSNNNSVETIQDSPSGSPSLPRRRRQQDGKKPGPRVSSTVLEFDPLIVTTVLETLSSVSGSVSGSTTTTNPVSSTGTQPTVETCQASSNSSSCGGGVMTSHNTSDNSNDTSHNSNGNTYNSSDNSSWNTYNNNTMSSEIAPYPVSGLSTTTGLAEGYIGGAGGGGSGTNSYCSSFNNSRCSSRTGSPTMNVTPSGSLENIKQYANNNNNGSSTVGGSTSLMSSLKRDDTVSKINLFLQILLYYISEIPEKTLGIRF